MTDQIKKRLRLGDGIHLNIIENSSSKYNSLVVYFIDSLNPENASLASLLARVLTRGSEKYPTSRDMSRALDNCYSAGLGAGTSKQGDRLVMSVSAVSLADRYSLDNESITSEIIAIFEDVLFHPYTENGCFEAGRVESEKKNAVDAIRAVLNNKRSYASKRAIELMFDGDPYSSSEIGEEKIIESITPEALTAYYKKLLKTAEIEIFSVGQADERVIGDSVRKMFDGMERRAVLPSSRAFEPKNAEPREITERMDVKQGNLVMGFTHGITSSSSELYAMTMCNSVLGGSLTGKLFTVLREQMSLCYSIFSACNYEKGTMMVHAGINPTDRDKTVRETLERIKEIKAGDISDKEISDSKNDIINRLSSFADNPSSLPAWYLPKVIGKDTEKEIPTPSFVASRIEKITREDIVRAAERIELDTVYFLTEKEN